MIGLIGSSLMSLSRDKVLIGQQILTYAMMNVNSVL